MTAERDLDIRNVRMYRALWEGDGMSLRTWDGRAITIDWGEPDADGFWTPTVTAHEPTEAQRIELARADLAAAIVAAVEGLPHVFAQYRCWDNHEDSPHGQPHADGSPCPDANGPMYEAVNRADVLDAIKREASDDRRA